MVRSSKTPDLPNGPAQSLPDVVGPGLKVIFCGLNPGASAAATGRHFEGRGNRFWPVLHRAGFTPTLFAPQDDRKLLWLGYGLTTAVERPTACAYELSRAEYVAAAAALERKVSRLAPRYVAFLGKAAYSAISGVKDLEWGEQEGRFGGARAWLLPNPSGLNRGFSSDALVEAYRELLIASERAPI